MCKSAIDFLFHVWRIHPKGKYVCISTKQIRTDDWVDTFIRTGPGLKQRLTQFFAKRDWGRNHHVYFCPNPFSAKSRTKHKATLTKWIHADCDEVNPRNMELKPSVAWETSKGRYAALWLMSQAMRLETTEKVNKHFAYKNDYDKSGWDYPQVLRVPGFPNHKYASKFICRVLWEDWNVKYDIPYIKDETKERSSRDRRSAFQKWEHKIPAKVRSLLKQNYIDKGTDRSKILFFIWHELFKAGINKEDALKIIKNTVWNKFKGRFTEDEQLEAEADKTANNFGFNWQEAGKLEVVRLTDIKEREVEFLWYPYIPKNKLTILEGSPGLGKSLIAMKMAADISKGRKLPGQKTGSQLKVLILEAEDALDDTVKPRLRTLGANTDNIFCVKRTFNLDPDGIDNLSKVIKEYDVDFVIIDPLVAYTPGIDSNKQSDMSPILDHLTEIADELKVTMLIIRHLRKGGAAIAIDEGAGSVRLGASVRSVLQVKNALDGEEGTRAILHIKCNVAKLGKTVEYEIIDGKYPDIEWGELKDYTWDDLKVNGHDSKRGPKSEIKVNVKDYILSILGDDALTWAEVEEKLENFNISASSSTVNHARSELKKLGKIASKPNGKNERLWYMTS